MEKLRSVLKSTAGDLLVAALVVGVVFMLVQIFNQGRVLQEISQDQTAATGCAPGVGEGQDCVMDPAAAGPAAASAPAAASRQVTPVYVTVTVAE